MKAGCGLAAAVMLVASCAAAASPCDRIAAFARQLPPKAWAAGDKALAPALVFNVRRNTSGSVFGMKAASPFEIALAKRPDVEKAINVDKRGDLTIYASRLGADLYEISAYDGSASCRSQVFVKAEPGQAPRIIGGPPWPADPQHMLCQGYGSDAGFARVFGHGVWVTHDMITGQVKTASLSIYPKAATGWGQGCKLDLVFRADYVISRRWCRDKPVCAAAGRIAKAVVVKYKTQRDSLGPEAEFHFGPPAPQAVVDRMRLVDESKVHFPGESDAPPLGFHGDSPAVFPIRIDGRWLLAAVGPDGVGWRTDEYTDFAINDFQAGRIVPLAGVAVKRALLRLSSAKVSAPEKGDE